MKTFFLTAFGLCLAFTAYTQSLRCTPLLTNLPQSVLAEEKNREQVQNAAASRYVMDGTVSQASVVTLTIPLVFHLIHQGGPENLADTTLFRVLQELNDRFSNTGAFQYVNGTDVHLQFCLASVDPFGNPTTGITRDSSQWAVLPANMGANVDIAMKNVNRWNPSRYLNVWLPKSTVFAMGFNAYAHFPWSPYPEADGVVVEALSVAGHSWLLQHEIGHYFGLYHTDQGDSCLNFNCLLDGDHVCDTPPVYRPADCALSSCNTDMDDTTGFSPFHSDTIDFSNVMLPVLPCNDQGFTQGQSDRMHYFLTNVRSNLLDAASCGGPVPAITPPTAGIQVSGNGCNGYQFTYTGTGAEYIEWDFNNDGYYERIGTNNIYSYGAAGYYTVKQRVFNGAGWAQDSVRIYAQNTNDTNFPIVTEVFSNPSNNGNMLCDGSTLTLTAIPNMAHYLWSTGDTTQTITVTANGSPVTVSVSCTDSLGVTWKHCPDSTFTWGILPSPAPFTLQPLTNDTLCEGQPFMALIPSQPGAHPWQVLSNGFPGINQDTLILYYWNNQHIWMSVVQATANYCKRSSDTLNVVFSRTIPGPITPGQNGFTLWETDTALHHQWFLDGVLIQGAMGDTLQVSQNGCYSYAAWDIDPGCATVSSQVCYSTAGLSDHKLTNVHVYPNPVRESCIIETSGVPLEEVALHDLSGRLISTRSERLSSTKIRLITAGLSKGVYLLHTNQEEIQLLIE